MQTTPETMSQPMDRTETNADGGNGRLAASSPVDDRTYNLLMALTSKLESIEVYGNYAENGDRDLWQQMAADDRRHADELLTHLKQRLVGS